MTDTLTDSLKAAKKFLSEIKRNQEFSRNEKATAATAQLQADLMNCRGKLERCKKEYLNVIKSQCYNIQEGQRTGNDTLAQEQILWDAALGYLLVRDAIYAVKTVSSYDSVDHAYEMLEAATEQIRNKRHKTVFSFPGTKQREEYGYLTSKSTRRAKEELLEKIFEKLKLTGDIEGCLDELFQTGSGRGGGRLSDREEAMMRLRSTEASTLGSADRLTAPDGFFDIVTPSKKE